MKVYVVSHGYDYESSIVVGVYDKEDDAISYVLNRPAEIEEREDGTDIEHKMEAHPKSGGGLYFSNDYGEYYTINEFEVK